MPLLGSAAMLLSFDIEAEAVDEHDRWHTHEHLPERLSIPGFRRGTRWIAAEPGPRYMVVYEVAHLGVLTSPDYLARLNAPTPWTTKMMPHYRGMTRGLCQVLGSFGFGQGGTASLIRFTAPQAPADALQRWLLDDALPAVPRRPGFGSAHLLQGAQAAPMTNEQRIRGTDGSVDAAILLTGYDADAVAAHAQQLCGADGLAGRGAADVRRTSYRWSYGLSCDEVDGAHRAAS
jgi:hypothetical protein